MNKAARKKLTINRESVRQLSQGDLAQAQGAAYSDAPDCVFTVPRSFCVCPTKHMCTINC